MLQVELRERMSTLRLCSSLKRSLASSGMNFTLLRIVEDRRRHRAAEIDVEAGPVALVVGDREAGQAGIDAAQHFAAPDRPLQGLGVVALVGDGNSRDRDCDRQPNQQAASECAHAFISHQCRGNGDGVKAAARLQFRLLPDDHLGADRDALVEVGDVGIDQPEAAGGHGGADRIRAGWCRGCGRRWCRDTSRGRRADCRVRRP